VIGAAYIDASRALREDGGDLARVHALRGADAVHLAPAQATGSDLLLSADIDLSSAARRCGIAIVELNDP
jgi:predicted nucleic acid-binding protein